MLVNVYQWYKALHIIFMVAWFAGLFYIFRLFVYHVKQLDNEVQSAVFTTMESKLLLIIMFPAMLLTLLFGLLMVVMAPTVLVQGWFLLKMAGVLGLIAYQFFAFSVHRQLAEGTKPLSEKACRIINEVPTVLLILIVIMAVVKPGM